MELEEIPVATRSKSKTATRLAREAGSSKGVAQEQGFPEAAAPRRDEPAEAFYSGTSEPFIWACPGQNLELPKVRNHQLQVHDQPLCVTLVSRAIYSHIRVLVRPEVTEDWAWGHILSHFLPAHAQEVLMVGREARGTVVGTEPLSRRALEEWEQTGRGCSPSVASVSMVTVQKGSRSLMGSRPWLPALGQ